MYFKTTLSPYFIAWPKLTFSEIKDILRRVIISSYKPGIVSEKSRTPDCHQINLAGKAWTHYSSFGFHSKSMLIQVLREANSRGWNLIASADVSAKFMEQVMQKYLFCQMMKWAKIKLIFYTYVMVSAG
jgi:hypothetical protein